MCLIYFAKKVTPGGDSAKAAAAPAAGAAASADETGVEAKDIELVMAQVRGGKKKSMCT